MDAREAGEAISDGINAIAAILAALEPKASHIGAVDMPRSIVAVRLEAMEHALHRLMTGSNVQTTLRVTPADLERIRALRQRVLSWEGEGAPIMDLRHLADECFAWIMSWRGSGSPNDTRGGR